MFLNLPESVQREREQILQMKKDKQNHCFKAHKKNSLILSKTQTLTCETKLKIVKQTGTTAN